MSAKRLTELWLGGGGSSARPLLIKKPMLMMFEYDGKIVCHIYPEGYDHALRPADLRFGAASSRAFKDRERTS